MTYSKVLLNTTNCLTPIHTLYTNTDDATNKTAIETIFPFIDFSTGKWGYSFYDSTHVIIYYYGSPCIWLGVGSGSDFGFGIGGNANNAEQIYSDKYGYISCEMYDNGAMILARTPNDTAGTYNSEIAVYPPISENLTDNDYLYGGIVKFTVYNEASNVSANVEYNSLPYILTQNTNQLYNSNLYDNAFVTKRNSGAQALFYGHALSTYTDLESIGLVELVGSNANHEIGVIGQNQIYAVVTMPTTIRGCKYIKFRDTAWRIVYALGNEYCDASHDAWGYNSPILMFNTGEAFTSTGDVTT